MIVDCEGAVEGGEGEAGRAAYAARRAGDEGEVGCEVGDKHFRMGGVWYVKSLLVLKMLMIMSLASDTASH